MIVVYGTLNTLTKLDTPEGYQFPVVSSKFPLIRVGQQGFFLLKRTPSLSWFIVNWIPADPEVIKDDKQKLHTIFLFRSADQLKTSKQEKLQFTQGEIVY